MRNWEEGNIVICTEKPKQCAGGNEGISAFD